MPRLPSVLVVIATLGTRDETLRQALASVVAQRYVDVRTVLVAPAHQQVVLATAARFEVEVIPDPGRGLSAAVNAGIRCRTDEEFLVWLGDDDLAAPGGFTVLSQLLRLDPAAVVAYGACSYINEEGTRVAVSRAGRWAQLMLAWGPDLIPQPASMYRLSAFDHVGLFDEGLRFAMDLDMFLRLRKVGPFATTRRVVAAFRWHADSLTVANRQHSMAEAERVKRNHLRPGARRLSTLWEAPIRFVTSTAAAAVERRSQSLPRAVVQIPDSAQITQE